MSERHTFVRHYTAQIPGARSAWISFTRLRAKAHLLGAKLLFRNGSADHIFTRIYHRNAWGDPESFSGSGSNLRETAALRPQLAGLLTDLGITSVLDIPCGDFNWMREIVHRSTVTYIGADIVAELVDHNNAHFASGKISFARLDIQRDRLPACDLVLCRDCLVHFSAADVLRALGNIKNSGAKYLLFTHFSGDREFQDILTGEWRPINFVKPPFHFPEPLRLLNESCREEGGRYSDKCLALYRVEDIPHPANGAAR